MMTPEENDLLCRVEGNAPMGQIMRRHWIAACLSEEVAEPDGAPRGAQMATLPPEVRWKAEADEEDQRPRVILSPGEKMPAHWPVSGTTGYEFAAVVNNLFVDARNERAMDDIYRRFARDRSSFADLVYRSKKQVLHETMSGDINSLGLKLLYHPPGRSLGGYLYYNNTIDVFENSTQQFANRLLNQAGNRFG